MSYGIIYDMHIPRTKNLHSLRCLGVAALSLYVDNLEDRKNKFGTVHYSGVSVMLREMVAGTVLPERTELLDNITRLFPASQRVMLYVGLDDPESPSHGLSLFKDSKTQLWRLRAYRPTEKTSREGVVVVTHGHIDNSVRHLPVYGTGGDLEALALRIIEDPNIARTLSLTFEVLQLFKATTKNRIRIQRDGAGGRIVFRRTDKGTWIKSSTFVLDSARAAAPPYSAGRVTGAVYLPREERVLPIVRNHMGELDPGERAWRGMSTFLIGQLSPFAAIVREDHTDHYCVSYEDPDVLMVKLAEKRTSKTGTIPHFSESGKPDLRALKLIHSHLSDNDIDEKRERTIFTFFDRLGYDSADKISALYDKHDIRLTANARRVVYAFQYIGMVKKLK